MAIFPLHIGVHQTTDVTFETGYQDILDEATTQTYTLPSASQQIKQNALYKALSDAGILAKLDLLYIWATDGDSDYSLINWINPTGTKATAVNSPTFTANQGWEGDGTSAYIETGVTISTGLTNQTLNDASIGVWKFTYTVSGTGERLIGNSVNQTSYQLLDLDNDPHRLNIDTSVLSATFDGTRTGFLGLNKPASGHNEAYYNGSEENDTTGMTNLGSELAGSVRFLTRGTASYSASELSMGFAGANMTGTEWSNFYSAMNTYIGSL